MGLPFAIDVIMFIHVCMCVHMHMYVGHVFTHSETPHSPPLPQGGPLKSVKIQ